MSEKLKFEIGADLAPLEKSLNDAGKQIKAFTDANKRNFERAGLAVAGLGVSIVAFARETSAAKIEIVRVWNEIREALSNGDILTSVGAITTAIGIFIGFIPTLVSLIAGLRAGFVALNLTILANPIVATLVAIGAIIGGLIFAVNAFGNEVEKVSEKTRILTEINKEAVKGMAKEKAELIGLVAVAKDETMSKDKRLKAVKKLNEISPEYLGNITLETINTEGATKAIDAYNHALTRKAQAQAAQSFLQKVIEKQMTFELDYQKATIGLFDKVLKAQENLTTGKGNYAEELGKLNRIEKEAAAIRDAGLASTKAEYDAVMQLLRGYGGLNIELKKTKEAREELFRPKDLQAIQGMQPTGVEALPSVALFTTDGLKEFREKLSEEQIRIQNLLLDLNESINALINDTIASTFSQLGDAIGNALATGGNVLQSVGATLLQQMGKFMSSFGDQLIRFGLSAKAFAKLQLSLGSPPATLASAGAAIAAGLLLKAAGAAVASTGGSFGGGGGTSNFSGSTATAQTSNVSGSSFSAQSGNEVVFRIAGNDLLGVLRRAENAENRIG